MKLFLWLLRTFPMSAYIKEEKEIYDNIPEP